MTPAKDQMALFIVPGENIETPSPLGYWGHKFDFIHEEFLKQNWKTRVVTDVYTRVFRFRSKYALSSASPLFIYFALGILMADLRKVVSSHNPLSYVNQRALENTYRRLLSRDNPTVVLTIGASEALVRVCREAGVECIEIQHGMFSKSDLEMYWPNGVCPDSFITWDKLSGQIAKEHGMYPRVLGHPDESQSGEKTSREKTSGDFVCVSLGYKAIGSEDPWGCFPGSLAKAIDDVLAEGLPILIRIHPNLSARQRKLMALNSWIVKRFGKVRIDNPNQTPLEVSVKDSFCNITVLSATWFDFALAGRPTLMLDADAAQRYALFGDSIEIWRSSPPPVSAGASQIEVIRFIDGARLRYGIPNRLRAQTATEFVSSLISR